MSDQPQIDVLADIKADLDKEAAELSTLDTTNQTAIQTLTIQLAAQQAQAKFIAAQKANLAAFQDELAQLQNPPEPAPAG